MRRGLTTACLMAVLAGHAAQALDVPLAGRRAAVGARARARVLATLHAGTPLAIAGSPRDPSLHGAVVRLFDASAAGGGAGDFVHPLPAAGWRPLGSPPGSAGWVYRGLDVGDEVCVRVAIGRRGVRVECRGDAVSLDPPFRGSAAVVLGVPDAGPQAALRYCAAFGGATRRNDDGWLLRRDAAAPAACPPAVRPPPNFIVINLDDTRHDGIDGMPVLQARLAGAGVRFSESFVPNALCCPSRASILTGLYSIHHGTLTLIGELGGADTFRQSGADRQTIAVWLRNAGYTTALFGKYMNEYGPGEADKGPGGTFYIPPGWDRWRAHVGNDGYGGVRGRTYEIVDESRTRTVYDDHSSDAQYGTDLLGRWLREFITDAVGAGRPFFGYWAPYASHGDPIFPAPAVRHLGLFDGLLPWRPPSWNEVDISDKPRWLSLVTPSAYEPGFTDTIRRRAYEALLAVDEQLALLLDHLAALGVDEHTLVLLTSDNGSFWGEHRLFAQLKEAPYEASIRVPMVARYPRGGRAGASVDAPVLNLDVPPTLMALAGLAPPAPVDGRSFAEALGGPAGPPPRRDFLLEHFRWARGHGLAYSGQIADGDQVRIFHGDPLARPRPSTLFEFDGDAALSPGAIPVPIGADDDASFAALRTAIAASVPQTRTVHDAAANRLAVNDRTPTFEGRYVRVEVDRHDMMTESGLNSPPDYVGVRDVAAGYTYVDYSTNEVELYDLQADPWQLENVAGDPAYGAVRAQLRARLTALLAGAP